MKARGLLRILKRLERALKAVFWADILDITNETNKILQSVSTDLNTMVHFYDSVIDYNYIKLGSSKTEYY